MLVSYKIIAVPTAQRLTVSRAEAPGSRDDGERGAAVDGAEVVLHVGCHVRVRWAEGRLSRPGRVWRQADEGDVGDDGAAAQRRRPGKETETRHHSQPPGVGTATRHTSPSHPTAFAHEGGFRAHGGKNLPSWPIWSLKPVQASCRPALTLH